MGRPARTASDRRLRHAHPTGPQAPCDRAGRHTVEAQRTAHGPCEGSADQGAGVSGPAGVGRGIGSRARRRNGAGAGVGTGVGAGVETGVGNGVDGGVADGGGTTTGVGAGVGGVDGRAVARGLGLDVGVGRGAGRAGSAVGVAVARRVEAAGALGAGVGGDDAAPPGGGVGDGTIPAAAGDGSKTRRVPGSTHAGSTIGCGAWAAPRAGSTGLEVGAAATMPARPRRRPVAPPSGLIAAPPATAMANPPITAAKTTAMRASPWRTPRSGAAAMRRRTETTGDTSASGDADGVTAETSVTGTAGSSRPGSPNMMARRCVATCSIAERSSASASRRRRTTGDTFARTDPRSRPRAMDAIRWERRFRVHRGTGAGKCGPVGQHGQ